MTTNLIEISDGDLVVELGDAVIVQGIPGTFTNITISGTVTIAELDLGTQSSGTLTVDMSGNPLQRYINGGAHALEPGTDKGSILLTITNNGSAGAITTSGWTMVDGDDLDTVNANKFVCHASVTGGGSLLIVKAMQ